MPFWKEIGLSELWSEQPINPPVDSSEWRWWDLGVRHALEEYAFFSGSSPSVSVSEPP